MMTAAQEELQRRRKAAQKKIEEIVERVTGKPFPRVQLAEAFEAILEAFEKLDLYEEKK